jgi:hypothetical protein
MKTLLRVQLLILIAALLLPACHGRLGDQTGPTISDITSSSKQVVISDCLGTQVTISARVSDASEIKSVLLWYRVGADGQFSSSSMKENGGTYFGSIKGADLQGQGYGTLEFYITAEDAAGNLGKSPPDKSIEFLPCVNN